MEPEIRRKIEQTVLEILNSSDMEDMTEFKVRVAASERLGIVLTDVESKKFVRGIVESFLLSTVEKTEDVARDEKEIMRVKEDDSEGNRIICKLSNKRNVVIQDFKGKSFVSIREFYHKDGRQIPTNKGINLNPEQWSTIRTSIPLIEEAIAKMQAKLRSNNLEQNEQVSNLETTTSQTLNGQIPETPTSRETNGHVSKSVNGSMPSDINKQSSELMAASTSHELNGEICDSTIAPTPQEFVVPIEVKRFNGKDYTKWEPMMKLFLKQLKLLYVLTDPCPSLTTTRPEPSPQDIAQAKAAEQKWLNNDYMCRRHILASLSDSLYNRYSSAKTAKELWEELRLVYLHEEFGKKRAQVKSYIEFQISDQKPILEQIHELNTIADSVVAAGIHFDEKFHVSTIISKLPPSWKDFCMKLMCEEHLPFWMLMDRIRMEEDSRNPERQVGPPGFSRNQGQGFTWKRREGDTDSKAVVCYTCGKRGHIAKNCRDRRVDKENSSTAVRIKTEMSENTE